MSNWLVNLTDAPSAPLRVVIHPHAGGQVSFYHRALAGFTGDADVSVVQPPGRESRAHEQVISHLGRLARLTAREIAASGDDRPTVLFGHSSGGRYALEVGRALTKAGRPPARLGVSGIPAPDHTYWSTTIDD